MKKLLTLRFWVKTLLILFISITLLFLTLIAILYWQQYRIVQNLLKWANENHKGEIVIKGSHITPFANFPYISIDLEELSVY